MSRFKHKVFIYSGGGYDGCFWEYNVCLWDEDGNFHNIFSTGNDGIKDEKDALETVKVLKRLQRTKVKEYSHPLSSRINHYTALLDYTKKGDCEEIIEYCATLVQGIVKFLDETLWEDHKIFIKCHVCEKTSQNLDDFELDEMRHQGIESWHQSFQCNECRAEFACTHCGEDYRGNEESLIVDKNQGPMCFHCYTSDLKDLREQGTRLIRMNMLDEAIQCRTNIEAMLKNLEAYEQKLEGIEPEPADENLLANDTTPFLPFERKG